MNQPNPAALREAPLKAQSLSEGRLSAEPHQGAPSEAAAAALLALRSYKPKELALAGRAFKKGGAELRAFIDRERGLFAAFPLKKAADDLIEWERQGICHAVLGSTGYPRRLNDLFDPPLIIFYQGDLPALDSCLVPLGIVGARASDKMSESLAHEAAVKTSTRGALIVSGLALGIDSAAHQGAVSAGGKTAAILGGGLRKIYPASNTALSRAIVERGGVLISEFEPDSPSYPPNFLQRNRIIAALSDALLLIQAGERSGSLVTAGFALELGRDVLVAPGAFWDKRFLGSNKLIKDGAALISTVDHLFEFLPDLPELKSPISEPLEDLSADAKLVLALCEKSSRLHFDDLCRHLSPNRAGEAVLELELNGLITRLPGNYAALAPK